MNGVVYVAYGVPAHNCVKASIQSLLTYNEFPITIIGNKDLGLGNFVNFKQPGYRARWAKLNIDNLTDYDIGLYLDADTVVHKNLQTGFKIIEDGWDLAIVPSINQNERAFYHLVKPERDLMSPYQLQLQGGMFFYHRERCRQFFEVWREEWLQWKNEDQGALVRALEKSSIKVYLLGRPWNGGSLVEHNFGKARWS